MAKYCVNKNAQPTGEHEVHKEGCDWLPDPENQVDLGDHSNCHAAVEAAKRYYDNVDGCAYCCPDCNKR